MITYKLVRPSEHPHKSSSQVMRLRNFSAEVAGTGDESPVSVINARSAMMSHPSSASTSMEHPVSKLHQHSVEDSGYNDNNVLRNSNGFMKVEPLMKPHSLNPLINSWPTKRMGWFHLQEDPHPHVEVDCTEDHTFDTESSSTDQEEGFSILCRDQDEDSLIDFFPSANQTGSVQREQINETVTALINDDNPKRGRNVINPGGGHQWKGLPTKWEDAERWLMKAPAPKNINEVIMGKAGGLAVQAAKKLPEASAQDKHPNHVHEVKRFGSHGTYAAMREAGTEAEKKRDMATQSTPVVWSRCDSPDNSDVVTTQAAQKTSPPRHNTPARRSVSCHANRSGAATKGAGTGQQLNLVELESCHLAKLKLARDLPLGTSSTWLLEEEQDETTCLTTNHDSQHAINDNLPHSSPKFNILEARASAWEDVERAKHNAKFKREEAKIEAWESLQRAEADAELRKLEVKLEKLRFEGREKILGKLSAAQRRAQDMRATAEAHKAEHLARVSERANHIRKNGQLPGTFINVCFTKKPT